MAVTGSRRTLARTRYSPFPLETPGYTDGKCDARSAVPTVLSRQYLRPRELMFYGKVTLR